MSNIANTLVFLEKDPKNYITIQNQTTNRMLGKSAIYLEDIPNKDLKSYILSQSNPNERMWVELRIKSGVTSKKYASFAIEIDPEKPNQNLAPAVPVPMVHQAQPMQQDFTGILGVPAIIEMNRKADRYEDKVKDFDKLEKKYDEATHENKQQDIEIRDLKTKLSMSEAQKEMAVMLAKAENRSFFDSDAFKTLMEKAPDVLASFVEMKGNGAAAAVGALGSPKSDTKAEFMEFVNDNLNDAQVNVFVGISSKMNNPQFAQELGILIKKY